MTLVEIGGRRVIHGRNNIAQGPVDPSRVEEIVERLQAAGFAHVTETIQDDKPIEPYSMNSKAYIDALGPTTGDLVRLGSTDLFVKVEKDLHSYGDECTFGDGKNLRDGMAQASGRTCAEALDLAIIGVLVIDWTGIFKADIGVKDGMIVGIGQAGNPDTMDGVDPAMVVGGCTEIITGEGKILTAGGIDTHIHLTCPHHINVSIASGMTTIVGGGTGPR